MFASSCQIEIQLLRHNIRVITMGGDGGTISSNRTYLRGAGKACHTADHPSNAAKRAKLEDAERARLILTTCAISGAVLDLTPSNKNKNATNNNGGVGGNSSISCSGADIVVCPYGKLYKREEALEALLRRSQQINNNNDALGSHVRGMKDLHPVRFYVTTASSASANGDNHNNNNGISKGRGTYYTATCPITSADIGSGNVASFVIVRSKKNAKSNSKDKKKDSDANNNDDPQEEEVIELGPNVISERAIKEMGIDGLQSEYGPFEEKDMIRLAPPKAGGVFDEIQQRWEARVEEERVAKMMQKKKKDKKRKRNTNSEEVVSLSKKKSETIASLPVAAAPAAAASIQVQKSSVADEAKSNIQTKVAQNPVLSSLFGASAGKKNQSEKEKRDALFTRNC
jgi:hypothetical protein